MICINMCSIHNGQWNFRLPACLLQSMLPRQETGRSGLSCYQSVTSSVLLIRIPFVKMLYFLIITLFGAGEPNCNANFSFSDRSK